MSDLIASNEYGTDTSRQLTVPVTWGVLRPVVVLPSLSPGGAVETAMRLRHELAHVCRNDVLWLNLTTLLTIVQWFNPLAWMVKQRLQTEAEYACDNYVLTGRIEPDIYARHILESARSASSQGGLITTHMAFNSHLEGRIMSILNNCNRDYLTGKTSNFWIATMLLFGCLTLAGFTLDSCSSPEQSNSPAALTGAEQSALTTGEFVAVDKVPEMTYTEPPVYPASARDAGLEGVVWIKVFVNDDGSAKDATVAKTSGNEEFDRAALAAAVKNRFNPAEKNGKRIGIWVTYKVEFELSDKKASDI